MSVIEWAMVKEVTIGTSAPMRRNGNHQAQQEQQVIHAAEDVEEPVHHEAPRRLEPARDPAPRRPGRRETGTRARRRPGAAAGASSWIAAPSIRTACRSTGASGRSRSGTRTARPAGPARWPPRCRPAAARRSRGRGRGRSRRTRCRRAVPPRTPPARGGPSRRSSSYRSIRSATHRVAASRSTGSAAVQVQKGPARRPLQLVHGGQWRPDQQQGPVAVGLEEHPDGDVAGNVVRPHGQRPGQRQAGDAGAGRRRRSGRLRASFRSEISK